MNFIRYKELPKELKSKPINLTFKFKDKQLGSIDCRIDKYYWCNNCNRMFNNNRTINLWSNLPKTLKTCSCGNKKPSYRYFIHKCTYTKDTCKVNRWGCAQHFKSEEKHFFYLYL